MEEVGVEAVVKGLQSFLGDMRKVNSSLDGLRPSGTLLQQMFDGITGAVANFGREVLNVAEVTLGVMLRDAIEFILGKLGELIQAVIDTGSEFQLLKIRLTGLNLNDFADGTRSFADAMALAGEKTKEELTWLQTLGSATPFDPGKIADTYTQARAFGFAADEAKRLTTDILNYTAGMGLSNETLFLIIQNLGQMVQRGKITGTEIRDLARGSFLPLADVLERVAKNMGITVAELTKQISTPAGVPASEFVKAFEQMVEEEPRFVGAAGRMSRALLPASQNVKELLTSIFGLNVVTPIFDILGNAVAGLVDQFAFFNEQGDLVKTQKWEDLVTAATNLGVAIGDVVKELLGFLPSSATLTDNLITGIQGLAEWIGGHREEIVGFFMGIASTIRDQVIPFFQRISDWVVTNWPTIMGFFGALRDIVVQVLGNLFGGAFSNGDILGGILDAIKGFMDFVIANKDQIAQWATILIQVVAVVEVLLTLFNIFIGILIAVVGAVITVIGVFVSIVATILSVGAAIAFLVANWEIVIAILGVVMVTVTMVVQTILTMLTISTVSNFISGTFVPMIVNAFENMRARIADAIGKIVSGIQGIDWGGIGASIISGIADGITSGIGTLIAAAVGAAQSAYDAAMTFLQGGSPSKLFEEIGLSTMEGMAIGIQKYAGLAAGAMTAAMQQVAMPSLTMPGMIQSIAAQGGGSNITNNSTRNYNLTVNSGAGTEPIVQDFNMLASLAG